LGLNEKVTFTGPLDSEAMALHLAASDLLVLLSGYEGFSHLLLEAMKTRLPVVASDVGGNRELIENGKSGILVPADEPRRIKESLLEVIGKEELRARLGRAGEERAGSFKWERMVDATLDVFQRAAGVRSS
jgi:glycosyltransferase involved in cell wall biosynthesis